MELEDYLHQNIPITKAIGIQIEQATKDKVILFAPFSNNINHKKTVFGGSLHAVATLACWSLLYLNVNEPSYEIVVTKSEVDYLFPVDADFKAICQMPELNAWARFIKVLQAKGKARILLTAKIMHKGHLAVDYHGVFALIKRKD